MKIKEVTRRQCTEVVVLVAIVMLGFAYFFKYWQLVIASSIVLLLGLVLPRIFVPFAWAWFSFGELLSLVTTKILLTTVFFILVWPIGSLRRLFKRDSFQLNHFKKNSNSVFKIREHLFNASDLKHPF